MDLGLVQLVVTHVLAARAGTWALQTVAQHAHRGKLAAHADDSSSQQRSKRAPLGLPSGARAKSSHHGNHRRLSATRRLRRGASLAHAAPAPFASATHAAAMGHAPKRPQPAQLRPPLHCAPVPTAWLLGGASLPWAGRQHPHPSQEQQPLPPPAPDQRREVRHRGDESAASSEEPQSFALSPDGLLAGLTGRTWPVAVHLPEPPPLALSNFHMECEPQSPAPKSAPESFPTAAALSSPPSSPASPPRGSLQPTAQLVGARAIGGGGGGAVLPGANDTLGGLMAAPVRGLRQLNQAVAAGVSEFLASEPGRRLTEQVTAEMSSGALMVPVYLTEELVKARLKCLLASHARWLIVYLAVRVSVASALVYGFKVLVRSLVRKRGPRWLRASVTFCCDVLLPTGFFGPLLGVTAAVVQLTGLGPFIRGYVAAAAGTAAKAVEAPAQPAQPPLATALPAVAAAASDAVVAASGSVVSAAATALGAMT